MKEWRLWGLLFAICLAACGTKQNPAATCTDSGMCTDPAFPYCDVDGAVAGQPGACIAAECAAGSFGTCDGSNALFCSSTGEGYDPMPCANGCDPASGCITCTANSESCANNVDTKCDASGTLTMTPCAIGCAANGSACAIPVPSNALETYIDMTPDPADLDLEDGTLDVALSVFNSNDGVTTTPLTSFDVPAAAGGAPIRVFVVKHLILGDIVVEAEKAGNIGHAVAFLTTGDIDVNGTVAVNTGALSVTGCIGNPGAATVMVGTKVWVAGSGGGGNATPGASGGSVLANMIVMPQAELVPNTVVEELAGHGGSINGSVGLVPLVGGCPGGIATQAGTLGAAGGGAIQLMSRTMVNVVGTIVTDGGTGRQAEGGGGGGGILIEAPTVIIAGTAKLLARGGGGGSSNVAILAPPLDGNGPPGASCSVGDTHCAPGGSGAPPDAEAGMALTLPSSPDTADYFAGGGGGGLGRIRVNTGDGTFTPAPSAILAADTTNGTMLTD